MAPVGAFPLEALAKRVVDDLRREGVLGGGDVEGRRAVQELRGNELTKRRRPPARWGAGGRAASMTFDQVTKKLIAGDQSLVVFLTVVRKRKSTVVPAVMPSRLVLATVVVPMASHVFSPSSEYCHS